MDTRDRLPIFAYVNAEKAPLYRAIMRAFMRGKEKYALHQRPHELLSALNADKLTFDQLDLQSLLSQLVEWGNAERHPDTSEVRTVQEFYQPRYLYRMTAAGEAAERAISFFEESLERPGELQTAALGDIGALLDDLDKLMRAEPDYAKAFLTFGTLFSRLNDLTQRAQTFLTGLQSAVDLRALSTHAFAVYKERLVEYLERFLRELVLAQYAIAERINRLDENGIAGWLDASAERELSDRLEVTDQDRELVRESWRIHWEGVRRWFLPMGGERPQAEELRHHARAAIPAFLAAVLAINEQHLRRSDRAADFKALARWFAECSSDTAAHRLWRAAFGLAPARHLMVDTVSLDRWEAADITPQTSWLEAPPLAVSLRLRSTGQYTRRGRPNNTIDRSAEKRLLAELAAQEFAQIEEARRRLATGRKMRLSEIGRLEPAEFDLFLELLATALSQKALPESLVETTSSDGAITIRLQPTEDGKSATLSTPQGIFCGNDHWITIGSAFGALPEVVNVTA